MMNWQKFILTLVFLDLLLKIIIVFILLSPGSLELIKTSPGIYTLLIQWLSESTPPSSPLMLIYLRNLNVFTQNKRSILQLHTDHAKAPVLIVAIGALLVGSIAWTVKEGDKVSKGDELGYFAYGGSTVIVLFPDEMAAEFD